MRQVKCLAEPEIQSHFLLNYLSANSHSDEQRGDLGILESEVVTKLNGASWEIAADLRGDNELVTVMRDGGYFGSWLGVRSRSVDPICDLGTVVIVGFIIHMGIVGEQRKEIGELSSVGGLEECRDGWREVFVHGVCLDNGGERDSVVNR